MKEELAEKKLRQAEASTWVSPAYHLKGCRLHPGVNHRVLLTERATVGSTFRKACSQAAAWSQGRLLQPAGELRSWTLNSGGRKQPQIQVMAWKHNTTWRLREWWKKTGGSMVAQQMVRHQMKQKAQRLKQPDPLSHVPEGAFSVLHRKSEVPAGNPAENI